jgi:hypothetical protein
MRRRRQRCREQDVASFAVPSHGLILRRHEQRSRQLRRDLERDLAGEKSSSGP